MANDPQQRRRPSSLSIFQYRYETAGRGPVLLGALVLIPLLLSFAVWAEFAPLNSAAIASGKIVPHFDRKTVQHLEGGIVKQILVEEGQAVALDAPILILDDINLRSQINTLAHQLANARAVRARLIAERDHRPSAEYADLDAGLDIDAKAREAFISAQNKLFVARKLSLQSKINLIHARKLQTENEISGIQFQLTALLSQMKIAKQELSDLTDLYDKGLITLSRKLTLEKAIVAMEGQTGSLTANIARLKQAVLTADIEVIDLNNEKQRSVLGELQTQDLAAQDLSDRLDQLSDRLTRTVIRAPASGRVISLQVHTEGAVISPGGKILEIVPADDPLIIEARLKPSDVDLVRTGSSAKIMLSAYKVGKVPKLDGRVINVSGDLLSDSNTGQGYFLIRVAIDDAVLETLKDRVDLYPGMLAEVFFLAGEQTVAEYLRAPITNAAYRAFREE